MPTGAESVGSVRSDPFAHGLFTDMPLNLWPLMAFLLRTFSPPPGALFVIPWDLTLRAGVLGPLRDPYGPDLRDPSRDGLQWGGTLRGPMALPGVPWLCPPWGVSLTYHSGVERWAVSAWPRKDATLGRPDRHACFPSKGFMPPDVESAKGTTASPS